MFRELTGGASLCSEGVRCVSRRLQREGEGEGEEGGEREMVRDGRKKGVDVDEKGEEWKREGRPVEAVD